MKVFVYGTLKQGYGNNRILWDAKLEGKHVIPGYKLYDCGFPVAAPQDGASVAGEVWELNDDNPHTLGNLDALEGEGRMYDRVEVEAGIHMYVGVPKFWQDFKRLEECPNIEKMYYWER